MTSWRAHALVIGLCLAVPLGALLSIAWWPEVRPPAFAVLHTPEPPTEDDQLVADTYPPRWSVGQSWVVEVEEDTYVLAPGPRRCFARYEVAASDEEHWVIEVVDINSRRRHFVVQRDPFIVTRPKALAFRPKPPEQLQPWHAGEFTYKAADLLPEVEEAVSLRLRPNVCHRGRFRQLGGFWGRHGLVFALGPVAEHTLVRWRKGEPWSAKVEWRMADPDNVLRHGRPARMRLIGVDDAPVEVLPWEYPPKQWASDEAASCTSFTQRSDLPAFERYLEALAEHEAFEAKEAAFQESLRKQWRERQASPSRPTSDPTLLP